MLNNIVKLKTIFNNLKEIRLTLEEQLDSLKKTHKILDDIYIDLLKDNKNVPVNSFDSLYFQKTLINIDTQHSFSVLKFIDNRIYADYYKLYKSLLKYFQETIDNKSKTTIFSNKSYKPYEDLNSQIHYSFSDTVEMYSDILQMIELLHQELIERETKVKNQRNTKMCGINIDSLINNIVFNNTKIKNSIELFTQNIIGFNDYHSKYLARFSIRIKLLYGQINNDIRIESNSTINNDTSYNCLLDKNEELLVRKLIENNSNIDEKNKIINEFNEIVNGLSDNIDNTSNIKLEDSKVTLANTLNKSFNNSYLEYNITSCIIL